MELFVYFEQYLVGILHKNEDDIYSFQYTEEWLDNTKGFDLSLQLLRRREPFGNRQTIAFFENLLPEGDVREVLLHHRTSGVFQTLRRYGKDCAGAIIISPESTPPVVSVEQSELLLPQDEIKKACALVIIKRINNALNDMFFKLFFYVFVIHIFCFYWLMIQIYKQFC